MSNDKLTSLGLFLLAPFIAFALIAANGLGQIISTNDRIADGEALGEFAARAAIAIDGMQAERANAAVILLNDDVVTHQQFRGQWDETDELIARVLASPAPGQPRVRFASDETVQRIQRAVASLGVLREQTMAGSLTLSKTSAGYTRAITAFTHALAREFEREEAGNSNFTEAFLVISHLHERVAIEAGIGLTAFYNGRIDPEAHQLFLEAGAPQSGLVSRFGVLTNPAWTAELDAVLAPAQDPEFAAARAAVTQGGYAPDRQVDQDMRTWWRDTWLPVYYQLGALRNRYAQDGLRAEIAAAHAAQTRSTRLILLQILVMFLAAAASVYGLIRVVAPDERQGVVMPASSSARHPAAS